MIRHSRKTSRLVLGVCLAPTQWVMVPLSLGVKRPEREVDHSPPSSAQVACIGKTHRERR